MITHQDDLVVLMNHNHISIIYGMPGKYNCQKVQGGRFRPGNCRFYPAGLCVTIDEARIPDAEAGRCG